MQLETAWELPAVCGVCVWISCWWWCVSRHLETIRNHELDVAITGIISISQHSTYILAISYNKVLLTEINFPSPVPNYVNSWYDWLTVFLFFFLFFFRNSSHSPSRSVDTRRICQWEKAIPEFVLPFWLEESYWLFAVNNIATNRRT